MNQNQVFGSKINLPRVICIDGVDGSGKGTISKMMQQELEETGAKVAVISPPFYETPSGQLVKEYLTNGYGCIQDRRQVSALYSADRNAFYKDYFDEIFLSGKYDYVIYNRNWLSNLFFQTTLLYQTSEDAKHFLHEIHLGDSPDGAMYRFYKSAKKYMTLASMAECLNGRSLEPDKHRALYNVYTSQRRVMVEQHMEAIYRMEIEPWKIQGFPFPMTCICANIVLAPRLDIGIGFLHANLMRRYEGDSSKLDRNEVNSEYLASVVENINWIHYQYYSIPSKFAEDAKALDIMDVHQMNHSRHISTDDAAKLRKDLRLVGLEQNFYDYELSQRFILDCFQFDIVETTTCERDTEMQRSINDIKADVWQLLARRHIIN